MGGWQRLALQTRLSFRFASGDQATATPVAPDPPSQAHGIRVQEPRTSNAGFNRDWQAHDKINCPTFMRARHSERWRRAATTHRLHCRRSRIQVRTVDDVAWCLGCWVCRRATQGKAGGSFFAFGVRCPQKSRLMPHNLSSLLQRIRRGEVDARLKLARAKCATMSWCLYEANREVERNGSGSLKRCA